MLSSRFYIQLLRLLITSITLITTYSMITLQLLEPLVLVLIIVLCLILLTWFEYKNCDTGFLCLPPAFYTLNMTVLIFSSGVFYFVFEQSGTTQFYVEDEFIVLSVWYTLASVQILWIGFYSLPARPYTTFSKLGFSSVPMWLINFFLLLSLVSFLVGVSTGTYGYTANQDNVKLVGLVRYGVMSGLLSIIFLAIFHYEDPKKRRYLYLVVGFNAALGVFFGSKSAVVQPLIILMLTNYMCGRAVKLSTVFIFALAVAGSFLIIEPFRVLYDLTGGDINFNQLLSMFVVAQDVTAGLELDYIESFFRRVSYVTAVGKTIEFSDVTGYYRSQEWKDLLLSPLYGAIPRLIWESKPLADFGLWASVNIFDLPPTTHTGILPVGYAYLVFRFPGIVIFFLLYGIIQRIGFNMFFVSRNLIPVFIFFYLFVLYPSYPVWTSVSSFVKMLVVACPLLFFAAMFGNRVIWRDHRI